MLPLFLWSGNEWTASYELMFPWSDTFSPTANISETYFLAFYSVINLTMGGLRLIAGGPSWSCWHGDSLHGWLAVWVLITGLPVWALPGNMVSSQYSHSPHPVNTTPHPTTPHHTTHGTGHTWQQKMHLWELLSPKLSHVVWLEWYFRKTRKYVEMTWWLDGESRLSWRQDIQTWRG